MTVLAVNFASTPIAKMTATVLIKQTVTFANAPLDTQKTIAPLTSTNALIINVRMEQHASMESPIIRVCVIAAGRDGC